MAPTVVGGELVVLGVDSASATYALHTTIKALKLVPVILFEHWNVGTMQHQDPPLGIKKHLIKTQWG